jgi:hypothetical protein
MGSSLTVSEAIEEVVGMVICSALLLNFDIQCRIVNTGMGIFEDIVCIMYNIRINKKSIALAFLVGINHRSMPVSVNPPKQPLGVS